MKYYSLNNPSHKVSFQEAVIAGLAPDRGLYFPESITPLPAAFFENIENLTQEAIAFEAIKQFVGDEIPETELRRIIAETLCFELSHQFADLLLGFASNPRRVYGGYFAVWPGGCL